MANSLISDGLYLCGNRYLLYFLFLNRPVLLYCAISLDTCDLE